MLATIAGFSNNLSVEDNIMNGEVPESETPKSELQRGLDLCEDITHAVEMYDVARRAHRIADSASNKVIRETMFGELPFRVLVNIPDGTEAYVTVDDEVVQQQLSSFLATEIRAISSHGAEFYDRTTGRWLKVKGFKFEVSPFFIDESLDPIEQLKRELDANDIPPEEQKAILLRRYQDLEDHRPSRD